MRKLLVVLFAGLLLFTLSACGGSSNKAKTASSDSDASDSDGSDSKSSSKKSGGSVEAFCDELAATTSSFSDIGDEPSAKEIDAVVKQLKALQDAAPAEIRKDIDTFINIEVDAANAAKRAGTDSDAQESAANEVIEKAGDDFIASATKVDEFAVKKCGVGLFGQTASDALSDPFSDFSDFSDFTDFTDFSDITDFSFSS